MLEQKMRSEVLWFYLEELSEGEIKGFREKGRAGMNVCPRLLNLPSPFLLPRTVDVESCNHGYRRGSRALRGSENGPGIVGTESVGLCFLPPTLRSRLGLYPSTGGPGELASDMGRNLEAEGEERQVHCNDSCLQVLELGLAPPLSLERDLRAFPGTLLSNALFVLSSLLVREPRDLVLGPVLPLACWVTLSKSLALTGPPRSQLCNEERAAHVSVSLRAGV